MTITTPEVVIGQSQVSTSGPIVFSNLQFEAEQQIVSLTDGTMLVVYRVDDGIFFQQVDSVGNPIGDEGQFDTPNYFPGGDFDVIAVENGDVVLAFEGSFGVGRVLSAQSFSIDSGVATTTTDVEVFIETEVAGIGNVGDFRNVSLAGSSTEDVVLQTLEFGTDGIQSLTTFTDLDSPTPQSFDTPVPFNQARSTLDTAILENGNIVTTVVSFGEGGTSRRFIDFFVTAPDGTPVTSGQSRVTDSTNVSESAVIALADGGFAVSFSGGDGGDIDTFTRAFDADGTPRSDESIVVLSNGEDFNTSPSMLALPDGGYLVVFDRGNAGGRIIAQRFDANGEKVGTFRTIEQGNSFRPSLALTADGLVAVTYVEGGNVQIELLAIEALDIVFSDADETITGTVDDDIIDGAGGDDIINGGDGDDILSGGTGTNTIDGGDGDDLLLAGAGVDFFDPGAGNDTVSYENSSQGVSLNLNNHGEQSGGDAEGDVFSGLENLIGTNFDDTLEGAFGNNALTGLDGDDFLDGREGDDVLDGGDGDDVLRGGVGADALIGGEGNDTADFAGSNAGVTVDLSQGTANGGHAQGDTLDSIENLIGSSNDDNLTGDDGANDISGEDGSDTINGGGGDDFLAGGAGVDTINGGDGDDRLFAGTAVRISSNVVQLSLDSASNTLNGGAGRDTIQGGNNNDTITGGTERDDLNGQGGDDVIDGGEGNDFIKGGDGDDTITGDDGDEFKVHLKNNDIIRGEDGDDTIFGGNGVDGISGGDGQDTIHGQEGNDQIEGDADNDIITGGLGNDTIDGGSGDDEIDGDEGDDTLEGGLGNDTIRGGAGDDIITDANGIDSIDGGSGNDEITVSGAGAKTVSGGSGDDIITYNVDTTFNISELKGDAGDDTINGGGGSDIIFGGSGNDTINAGDGNDTVNGGDGDDDLEGNDGDDTINGDDGDDVINGNSGTDILNGDAGNDTFFGSIGGDTINGGSGTDTVSYGNSAAGVDIELDTSADAPGTGTGGLAEGDTFVSIENVIASVNGANRVIGNVKDNEFTGGSLNDILDGAEGDDILNGERGDDILVGGEGSDEIFGGSGNDTARYLNSAGDFAYAVEADGRFSVTAANGDVDLLDGIEFLEFSEGTFTQEQLLNAGGTSGDDVIVGTQEADELFGFVGDDTISGLAGDDIINGNNGADTIDGGEGNDVVDGGNGSDVIEGGLGDDTLNGGGGIDTLSFANFVATDGVTGISLNTGQNNSGTFDTGGAGSDTISDIENLLGSDFNDNLAGLFNVIDGGAGDDNLGIALFALTPDFIGGDGVDTFDFSDPGFRTNDEHFIDLNVGYDFRGDGESLDGTLEGIENVKGSVAQDTIIGTDGDNTLDGNDNDDTISGGGGNDTILGGAGDDELNGGDGQDFIDGGTGGDTMSGGAGDDVYVVDDEADVVIELADEGADIIDSFVSFTIPVNVEVLRLQGEANINATGSDAQDILQGNSGENVLDGRGGIDVMQGFGGNDTYSVDNSFDAVIEEAGGGFDNVFSSVDYIIDEDQEIESAILTGTAVILRGSNSNNQLIGNDVANVIDGRGGTDFLLGLGGDDIFQISKKANDIDLDVIGDFEGAGIVGGDRLAFDAAEWGADGIVTQLSQTSFSVSRADGTNAQQFIISNLEEGNSGLLAGDDFFFA